MHDTEWIVVLGGIAAFLNAVTVVASTLGAALVYPGPSLIEFGQSLRTPPFVSGVGPVLLAWLWSPLISMVLASSSYLLTRTQIFRKEDSFHKALWMMPAVGCIAGGTVALLIICVVGPPLQYLSVDRYNASPQAIVVFVTAAGSLGCLATCLAIPHLTRRLSSRGRAVKVLKRMNLLGLDDATMASLTAQDKLGDVQGWAQRAYAWLFEGDLFAGVATDNQLMRIHSAAEQFNPAAEETLVPFQAIICMFLSVNHGANNASSSVGVFTMMLALHDTGVITETVHIHFMWRAIHAVGMTLGTVLLGFRLAPVAGVLLAKMTPFRSCLVILNAALALVILGELQLKGGVLTYAIVRPTFWFHTSPKAFHAVVKTVT
ncbi:Na+/Pi symporter [Trebouxia sp. C0009 RCD-2024]